MAAKERGCAEGSLNDAEALEIWALSLPEKQYATVIEQLKEPVSPSDGMDDATWVDDWNREAYIRRTFPNDAA